MRLARHVFEASRVQQLRFQGVFVNGGIDEVGVQAGAGGVFSNYSLAF